MNSTGTRSPVAALGLRSAVQALTAWISSSFADRGALERWLAQLERLLGSSPELARDVGGFALGATQILQYADDPEAVLRVVRIGLEAALLDAEPPDRAALAMLMIAKARALGRLGDAYASAQALRDARDATAALPDGDPLGRYVALRWACSRASSLEAELEIEQAAEAYREALALAEPLLVDGAPAPALAGPWIEALLGNGPALLEDGTKLSSQLLTQDLRDLAVSAALGSARCGVEGAPGPSVAPLDALERCVGLGIPHGLHPFELRPLVLALSPVEAGDVVERLIQAAERAPWIAERSPWPSLLRASEARVHALAGDLDGANERVALAMAATMGETDEALAWAVVAAETMMLWREPDGGFADSLVDGFITGYGSLFLSLETPVLSRRIKAAFDGPLAALTAWAAARYRDAPSLETSSLLSLVLDAQRTPEHMALLPAATRNDDPGLEALAYAADGLQRLRVALAGRPDSLALVVQPAGDETLFAAVTGDGLELATAPVGYREAAAELVEAMREDLEAMLDGFELDAGGASEAAGRRAYAAIPEQVRSRVGAHAVVLVIPDFASEVDGVPYELLHDDEGFLGVRKVIARFASLAAAARALEPPWPGGEPRSRALVVAAPRVAGYPELRYAVAEAEAIRRELGEMGWDAPATGEDVLDPDRLIQTAELADLVHVAGHGDTVAGDEALLLADEARVSVAEIERRALPRLPLCFINACLLGRTRYVGGGVSRGIAHAFHAAGAPAVVANTLPVEDERASRLAVAFHRLIQDHPAGEALRLARCEMHEADVPAASWGATMLIGDPSHRPGEPPRGADKHWPVTVDDLMERLGGPGGGEGWADPRAAAGALLEARIAGIDDASPRQAEVLLQVAESLGHPAAEVFARYAVVQRLISEGPGRRLDREVARLVSVLKALEPADERWRHMRMSVQADAKRAGLARGGEEIRVFNAATGETTDDADAIRDVLLGAQAESEAQSGGVEVRVPENAPADMLWNAVVLGHRRRIAGTAAAVTYTRALASKLDLSDASRADAARVLLGVLTGLWDLQQRTHLPPERAAAETRVVSLAVDAVTLGHAPPPAEQTARVAELLDGLDGGGDTDAVADALQRLLDEAPRERLAAWTAWTHGAVLERGTPSALAGSAAIERAGRLAAVYHRLARNTEGSFMDWLSVGYAPVREQAVGIAERWRWDR